MEGIEIFRRIGLHTLFLMMWSQVKKFYIPDLIEDVVASQFWGSVWYSSNAEYIWTGEKLELDYSIYDRFVKIG